MIPWPWPYRKFPNPRPADWGLGMTVCIAAIVDSSDEGPKIVLGSDKKLSMVEFSSDRAVTKMRAFHDEWQVMFAGNDITSFIPILNDARASFAGKENTLDNAIGSLKAAYQKRISDIAADKYLSRFKLNMDDFIREGKEKLTPDVFDTLVDRIVQIKMSLQFLVCGFDKYRVPHVFLIENPGSDDVYDSPGFWAIGTGAQSALSMLCYREQNIRNSLAQTVYNVCEAKFMSESASDVGEESLFYVIAPDCNSFSHAMN